MEAWVWRLLSPSLYPQKEVDCLLDSIRRYFEVPHTAHTQLEHSDSEVKMAWVLSLFRLQSLQFLRICEKL